MNDETQRSPQPPIPTANPAPTVAQADVPNAETLKRSTDHVAATATFATSGKAGVEGYEIISELGRGGMGVVYKARHLKLNRIVALKMVLADGHANANDIARFVAEAEAVAAIRHPNVIQVFDSGESQGHPFMAMECLEGGSLTQRIRASGTMPPRAAAELVAKIAAGVQAAHDRGIVHRDLKPHNVLLDAQSATSEPWGEPKVMDFGLAKRDGAELTQTGAVMGTPAYMSPEQAKGETKNIGHVSDVYSLGVILYECLTGSVPFKGSDAWSVIRQVIGDEAEPPARRMPGVPRELDLVCRKCLAKEPAERYASATALADDLHRYLNGESLLGARPGFWHEARRVAKRRWRPAAAGAALLALIIIAWFLPSPLDMFRKKEDPGLTKEEDPGLTRLRQEITREVDALRESEPTPDRKSPHAITAQPELPPTDYSKFKVFKDECTVDMRGWKPLDPNNPADECAIVSSSRREMTKVAAAEEVRIETRTTGRNVINRAQRPNPNTARAFTTDKPDSVGSQAMKVSHLVFDVSDIPLKQAFTLRYTSTYWNSLQTPDTQWFSVVGCEGSVTTSMLILFPTDRPFLEYKLLYAPIRQDDPTKREDPRKYAGPVIKFASEDKSWVYWEISNPTANYIYRIDWTW